MMAATTMTATALLLLLLRLLLLRLLQVVVVLVVLVLLGNINCLGPWCWCNADPTRPLIGRRWPYGDRDRDAGASRWDRHWRHRHESG